MPKKVATINKFKAGVNSVQDPRDLPEDNIADGLNIMTDIEGKVRQMGRDIAHPLTGQIGDATHTTPGYGFFAFTADNRIFENIDQNLGLKDIETSILVYQTENKLGFFDTVSNNDVITLGNIEVGVIPAFYYSSVDGALRICDANFNNLSIDSDNIFIMDESNIFTKYFKYMNKAWFNNTSITNFDADQTPIYHQGWIANNGNGLDNFIYPPTIPTATTALTGSANNTHNLIYHHATNAETDFSDTIRGYMTPGNIGIEITEESTAAGGSDWLTSDYNFGVSFTYEGDQESPITNYASTFKSAFESDGGYIKLQVHVCTGGTKDSFDPRIKGCNIYLTGDTAGEYEDPYFLAEFYWGSSELDPPKLTTSDGNFTTTFTNYANTNTIYNTTPIAIYKTPVITYAMRNGYATDIDSMFINYKTAVIANRRCYAGNVRRYQVDVNTIAPVDYNNGQNEIWKQPKLIPHTSFEQNDLMIVSPVDKYDIFPDTNTLDIGSSDGDHIVALIEYSDRLLQFKKNKLFIINISEEFEFIEAQHEFMGINYPYQVTKTDSGIAWVNANGCFLYNGEEVLNLTENKIGNNDETNPESTTKFPSWNVLIGNTSMIGYIPKHKQIIIFQNPHGISTNGNILIYDIDNEAWSRGVDRVQGGSKSNVINTYDDTLLYACPATIRNGTNERYELIELKAPQYSQSEIWMLKDVNTTGIEADPQGSQLQIGSQNIMNVTDYPDGVPDNVTFAEHVRDKINEASQSGRIDSYISGNDLLITTSGIPDSTYTGQSLSWNTGSSMGAPVTNVAQTFSPISSEVSNKYFTYVDGSDISLGNLSATGVIDPTSEYSFGFPSPFQHWYTIGYSAGPKQFSIDVLRYIAKIGFSSKGFDVTANDEPRIKITEWGDDSSLGAVYTWADASTASELVVDLYSKELYDNSANYLGDLQNQIAPSMCTGNTMSEYSTFYSSANGISPPLRPNLSGYNNKRELIVFYSTAPEEDGSGEDTSVDNGSTPKQWLDAGVGQTYYERHSKIQVPSAIFTDQVGTDSSKWIIIPGKHADKFIEGKSYTVTNSGLADANRAYVISDVFEQSFEDYDDVYIEDNYKYVTYILYTKSDNTSFFDNVPNWTSFEDIVFTGASSFTGIGEHTIGRAPIKGEYALIPKRSDSALNHVNYSIAIEGQNDKTYYTNSLVTSSLRENSIVNEMKGELERLYLNRSSSDSPWWDSGTLYIPGAQEIYLPNSKILATSALDGSSTTPFTSGVLGDNVTLDQVYESYGISIGSTIMARDASANWEVMKITAIASSGISVSRNFESQSSTGSAVNFGTTQIQWFLIRMLYAVSGQQIRITGPDITQYFTNNISFAINDLGNDTDGDDAWASPYTYTSTTDNDMNIADSSQYDSTNGHTDITINGSLTYGSTTHGGTTGAYYMHVPDTSNADLWGDNMAGKKPGDEFVSDIQNKVIPIDNQLIRIHANHIIGNDPDYYNDLNIGLEMSTGLEFRRFANDPIDTFSSNTISNVSPCYVLTKDLVLDDDMYSNKVLYKVSVTCRYSSNIVVEAIVNGKDIYILEDTSMETRDNTMKNSGITNLSSQNLVTRGGINSSSNLPWKTLDYGLGTSRGDGIDYIKKAKTVQFKIIGVPGGYGFEVNDISVVYRPLDIGR